MGGVGGWLHHGGKKSLRSFKVAVGVGGGGYEGFFMSLDRNLNASVLLANSLKYYQTAFSYQAE